MIKYIALMFLAACGLRDRNWDAPVAQVEDPPPYAKMGGNCNTLESEIQYDWYGYLGVAPFIQPAIICADMDLLEDDYVTFTYANIAPIDVFIEYENLYEHEAVMIIREFKFDDQEGMVWGPVIEESMLYPGTHSTALTVFPIEGYHRLFIAIVPASVELDSVPYKLTIETY